MTTHRLNPDHPVSRLLEDNKEKILAAVIGKVGPQTIHAEDIDAINGMVLLLHARPDGLHLSLVTPEVGEALISRETKS